MKTPFIWSLNISIVKNTLLWFQLFMVSFVVFLFMLILLLSANLFQYQWDAIPSSLVVSSIIGGGFFITLSLVLFLIYIRGIPTSYVFNEDSIEQYTLNHEKKSFSLLALLGIASGKSTGFTAAGANLVARSRQHIVVKFSEVKSIENHPNQSEIRLKNEWRTLMQVICPKEEFEVISAAIINKTQQCKQPLNELDKKNKKPETTFAKKLLLSFITLVFGGFLFVRLPIHYVGVLAIVTIILAFLSLWTNGRKQTVFAIILSMTPIIAVLLGINYDGVSLSRSGSFYALTIEIILIAFFILLGLSRLFKNILTKEKSNE